MFLTSLNPQKGERWINTLTRKGSKWISHGKELLERILVSI